VISPLTIPPTPTNDAEASAHFERWAFLSHEAGALQGVRGTYSRIVQAYETPPRTYHNLGHVAFCLAVFDLVSDLAADPMAVEFAIWFHDAIYDSKLKNNEEMSAAFALESLGAMGIGTDLQATVHSLILLTKHDTSPETVDGGIIIDVDLAILGADRETYDRYERAIRDEYSWLSDDEYRNGRRTFLEGMLARKRIYHTERLAELGEEEARKNMQRAVDSMV